MIASADRSRGDDVRAFIIAITEAGEQLTKLSSDLRGLPTVSRATHSLQIRRYAGVPTIEASVDAELRDGTAAAWTLDISLDQAGSWHVDTAFRRYLAAGEAVPYRAGEITSIDTFADLLQRAVAALVAVRPDTPGQGV